MPDYNGFCTFVFNSNRILITIFSYLGITKILAMEQAQKFFQDKKIVVQADGVQGTVYKINSYLQSVGSARLVTQTLRLAKSAGVNDLRILRT